MYASGTGFKPVAQTHSYTQSVLLAHADTHKKAERAIDRKSNRRTELSAIYLEALLIDNFSNTGTLIPNPVAPVYLLPCQEMTAPLWASSVSLAFGWLRNTKRSGAFEGRVL